jgi:hypothetical protein
MPVKIWIDGKEKILHPTTKYNREQLETKTPTIKVDKDFYVYSFNMMGN